MGSNVSIDDMPDVVHTPYSFLLDETGVEPTVERIGYGKMLLTHTGPRTKMTIQFRLDKKWRWEKSRLFIDGKAVPLAKGWEMYVAIFKDPDNGRHSFIPKGAKKAVVPESQPVDEKYLPNVVAKELASLRKASENEKTEIAATVISKANQYMITLRDTDSGKAFSLTFGFEVGRWTLVDIMLINAMGYDVSRYVSEGEVDEFLHELMGITGRDSQVSYASSMQAHDVAGASNSVMARRASVYRI